MSNSRILSFTQAAAQRSCHDDLRQCSYVTGSLGINTSSCNTDFLTDLTNLDKFARSDCSIVLNGETGVPLLPLAENIHTLSGREGRIVVYDCGRDALTDSELFGHKKGAYTGAEEARQGVFERIDGGTLVLYNPENMPWPEQAKVLRVIESKKFRVLGSNEEQTSDFRIIAISRTDLRKQIKANAFREDLFYRLAIAEITVPPLRERPHDIIPLAQRALESYNWSKKTTLAFSAEALYALEKMSWAGNELELFSAVERAAVLCNGNVIQASDLVASNGYAAPMPKAA